MFVSEKAVILVSSSSIFHSLQIFLQKQDSCYVNDSREHLFLYTLVHEILFYLSVLILLLAQIPLPQPHVNASQQYEMLMRRYLRKKNFNPYNCNKLHFAEETIKQDALVMK